MTILLPLEIKVRELHSKIFLASKILQQTKFDVVIGEKSKVYNIFKHNESVYLLSKGGPRLGFHFDKKNFKKNFIGILDEEGPISNFDINEKKSRLNNHILKNIDNYYIWGNKDLENNKSLFKNLTDPVINFGHPKFDILKKNEIKFYKKEINRIKKKFGKFIFVSSSFPVDQIMQQKSFNKFRFNNFFFVMEKEKEKIKERFNRYLELEKENYLALIKLINLYAEKNPNINIIFRPHPRQKIDLVKKRFKKNKNVKIIYEGVITPWIAACELYMHGGCTSFLEAATLKKKMIYFVKHNHEKKANMFCDYGYFFRDLKKCINFMNMNIKKNNFNLKKTNNPIKIVRNSSNNFYFYKNFIKFLSLKYKNKLKPIRNYYDKKTTIEKLISKIKFFLKKVILKIPLLTNLFFLINPGIILTYEYKKQKFPSLSKNELNEYLFRILFKKNIRIKQLSEDLFLLRKN